MVHAKRILQVGVVNDEAVVVVMHGQDLKEAHAHLAVVAIAARVALEDKHNRVVPAHLVRVEAGFKVIVDHVIDHGLQERPRRGRRLGAAAHILVRLGVGDHRGRIVVLGHGERVLRRGDNVSRRIEVVRVVVKAFEPRGRVRIPLRVLYVHVYGQSPTAAKPTRGLRQVPCVYEHILFGCTVHDLCACMTACGFKPADVEKAVRRVLDSVRARVQARLADVPASLLSGLGSHRVAAVQWKKLRTQKHESRLCKVLALGACVTLLIVFRLVADHRPLHGDGEALGALRDFLGRCVHHEVEIDPAELRALERGKAAVEGADNNAGAGPSDEKAQLMHRLQRFEHAAFHLDDVEEEVLKEQQLMRLRLGASEV